MTPANLETFVRQRYNAVGDDFFPQAAIYNFFWQAMAELAMETQCIKNIYTTTSVASQRAYDFPSNAISIARVEYNGQRIFPNDLIDDDAMTGNNPDETITGTPDSYQKFGDTIYLRPVPSTSGQTIKVFSYDLPTQPSSSGTLDVPERYHLMLADYALHCMAAQDDNHAAADRFLAAWMRSKQLALEAERLGAVSDSFRVVKDADDLYLESRFI